MSVLPKRLACLCALALLQSVACGSDWPTCRKDNRRSARTEERLPLPLREMWRFETVHEPQPAWPPPALEDYWHKHKNLRALVTFDRACKTVSIGDMVYFGSSVDDRVFALDARTGRVKWTFYTEGPVRIAPTWWNGRLYVGSDDGWAYCLNAASGELVWKHRPGPTDRRLPGNGRVISLWPVRTSVLIEDGLAYFCAGLFPKQGVFLCALNAEDGSVIMRKKQDSICPQGYLLSSSNHLFIPLSRVTPAILDRKTGEHVGNFNGQGGAYALLTEDMVVNGPGRTSGGLDISDAGTREHVATFDGLHLIVHDRIAYLHSDERISAFDRVSYVSLARTRNALNKRREELEKQYEKLKNKKGVEEEITKLRSEWKTLKVELVKTDRLMTDCFLWSQPCSHPFSFVMAGGLLLAGGSGEVAAFSAADGKQLWSAPVNGDAYGLAVANGKLLASTDKGAIHCFGSGDGTASTITPETVEDPYPKDAQTPLYEQAAERMLAMSSADKGYCLVLDCGEGRLAFELARRSNLRIVGLEEDQARAAAARKLLTNAGLYGARVAVHTGSLSDITYPTGFANLIVSERTLLTGRLPDEAGEISRILRPYGGMACFGAPDVGGADARPKSYDAQSWIRKAPAGDWKVSREHGTWVTLRLGRPAETGEWTHFYCDPGNTSYSGDQVTEPFDIQWFGGPGPRKIINRHSRPMSPLFKDGRVFVPANNRVIAVDAYNGTELWETEVPESRRLGALKDCGYLAATDGLVYATTGAQCWALDAVTGELRKELVAPQLADDGEREWGYLAVVGDRVFGSGKRPGSSFYRLSYTNCAELEGDFRVMVISDYLFSLNRLTGERAWQYSDGLIMNATLAIGDGRVYFVQSRSPRALEGKSGRICVTDFCQSDTHVVALDATTGKVVWKRPFRFPYQHIFYLSHARGVVLTCGSFNRDKKAHYGLFAFDAKTGTPKWDTSFDSGHGVDGTHGEQWQHPVIRGDTVYAVPYDFNLQTGVKGSFNWKRGGHGCGTISGCARYLFARGGNPRLYEIAAGGEVSVPLTHTNRPGCFINIIPVGGLVVIPESSSGCTCAYPLQLSIAFAPKLEKQTAPSAR